MNTGMAKTLALVFALALMTVISTESEAQKGAWKIGPRTLPVPVDVSDVSSWCSSPCQGAFGCR
jgi:hypothetical protein